MEFLLVRLEERVGLDRADLLGVALALVGCVVATLVALRVPLLAHVAATPAPAGAPSPAVDDTADDATPRGGPLLVHVTGAVDRPGVVELRVGDRVADAVAAAGGALPDAALTTLNLARPLVDGEQVVVATAAEVAAGGTGGGGSGGAGAGADAGAPTGGALLPDGRLDLNRATVTELEDLPGVGPVLAQRIVAHRERDGPFTDAGELRRVSGIGPATWEGLRDLVAVP